MKIYKRFIFYLLVPRIPKHYVCLVSLILNFKKKNQFFPNFISSSGLHCIKLISFFSFLFLFFAFYDFFLFFFPFFPFVEFLFELFVYVWTCYVNSLWKKLLFNVNLNLKLFIFKIRLRNLDKLFQTFNWKVLETLTSSKVTLSKTCLSLFT